MNGSRKDFEETMVKASEIFINDVMRLIVKMSRSLVVLVELAGFAYRLIAMKQRQRLRLSFV